jgi:hypothetical protein
MVVHRLAKTLAATIARQGWRIMTQAIWQILIVVSGT